MKKLLKITLYLNESDQWQANSLYLEVLSFLRENKIAGATVIHAIAGFTGSGSIQTTTLVDIDGKLPIVIESIDTVAKLNPILPELKRMIGDRLMTLEPVEVWG